MIVAIVVIITAITAVVIVILVVTLILLLLLSLILINDLLTSQRTVRRVRGDLDRDRIRYLLLIFLEDFEGLLGLGLEP